MRRQEKGITLIALIITIIILLILAGISLHLLIGNNGILNKTQLAKKRTEIAQNESNLLFSEYENLIESYKPKEDISSKVFWAEHFSFIPEDISWNVENIKEALDYLYNI